MHIQRLLLGAETDGDPPREALKRVSRQTPLVQLFFLVARIAVHLFFLVCRLVFCNLKLDARLISPPGSDARAAAPGVRGSPKPGTGLTVPEVPGQVYQLTGKLPCPL